MKNLYELSCGDSSCIMGRRPHGMMTNGGCRCFAELRGEQRVKVLSAIYFLKRQVEELEKKFIDKSGSTEV